MIRKLLFFAFQFPTRDMWFQASAKIGGAHASVDDGEDDQDHSDDGEGR